MDTKKFKKYQKPASCTQPPWQNFIPPSERAEKLRIIRQECIDEYGYAFDECPKRKVCITKSCLGRPLPWKSKTARPYLKQLQENANIQNGEMFIQTDCTACPLFDSCKSPCNQVIDFIERDKSTEPLLNYSDKIEYRDFDFKEIYPKLISETREIPWDCLTEKKQQIVKMRLYDNRDYRYIAESFGLYNQAYSKYLFYLALNRLVEFGKMRDFIEKHRNSLNKKDFETLNLVYYHNMSQKEASKFLGVSKSAVSGRLKKVKKIYKLTFYKFVRRTKNGGRVYSTLEIIR